MLQHKQHRDGENDLRKRKENYCTRLERKSVGYNKSVWGTPNLQPSAKLKTLVQER